jgi:2'-5' RNA ligase
MPERGRTALVVPVPELEEITRPWRQRFDPSAAKGMPPHITILFPFARQRHLSPEGLARLATLCAAVRAPTVTFARCRRFAATIWLAPDPATPFAELTRAVVAEWPDLPPYGGAYDEIVPHVTLGQGPDTPFNEIEREIAAQLPVRTVLHAAALFVPAGGRWEQWHTLLFS